MGRARDRASADLNGQEFILDADADTSISADTDDQIDIKIAGADDFQFTANTFTAQSGSTIAAQALTATTITTSSTIDVQGNEIILDDDGDTSITADSDDTINFKVGGTDRVTMDVNGDVRLDTGDVFFATAGKGICLGATTNADANTLDDYEEGTWTPTVVSSGVTAATANGHYTKVGKLVTCTFDWRFPSTSDTSNAQMGGFPFAMVAANEHGGGFFHFTNATNGPDLTLYGHDSSFFSIVNGSSVLTNANVSGATFLGVLMFYTNS